MLPISLAGLLYVLPDLAWVLAHSMSSFTLSLACSGTGGTACLTFCLSGHRQDGGDDRVGDCDDQRGQPDLHGLVQGRDQASGQRREGTDAEQPGAAEHAGAEPGLLALFLKLCLGQLHLLLDQGGRVVRKVLQELAGGPVAQLVFLRSRHLLRACIDAGGCGCAGSRADR